MKARLQAVRALALRGPVRAAALAAAAMAGASAQAQTAFTVDASSIIPVITGGVTTISAIGIAVLSLVVVIKLFKWVQRVL